MGGIGCFVCFVLAFEHVGQKVHSINVGLYSIFFSLQCWLALLLKSPLPLVRHLLVSRLILFLIGRHFRLLPICLYLVCGDNFVLFYNTYSKALVGLYWLVPESIRWLIGAGKLEDAKEIVEEAARSNRRVVPYHLFNTTGTAVDNSKYFESLKKKASVLNLFHSN